MPANPKFPPAAEIKRVLAAVQRVGVEIGSIEIHPRKIVIHRRLDGAPGLSAYDLWKMSESQDTALIRHANEESDALRGKTKAKADQV